MPGPANRGPPTCTFVKADYKYNPDVDYAKICIGDDGSTKNIVCTAGDCSTTSFTTQGELEGTGSKEPDATDFPGSGTKVPFTFSSAQGEPVEVFGATIRAKMSQIVEQDATKEEKYQHKQAYIPFRKN